jgi:uncharacterized protein YigA (DUF484 family)
MAQIFLPHPHGGRAVSLAERQMLTLRDKNRQTESKLAELIAFGEENDRSAKRCIAWRSAWLPLKPFQAVIHLLNFHLRDDFLVPHVALRLWHKPDEVDGSAGICRGQRRVAGLRRNAGPAVLRFDGWFRYGFVVWRAAPTHIRSQALDRPAQRGRHDRHDRSG